VVAGDAIAPVGEGPVGEKVGGLRIRGGELKASANRGGYLIRPGGSRNIGFLNDDLQPSESRLEGAGEIILWGVFWHLACLTGALRA
jgi:hypothetical protein